MAWTRQEGLHCVFGLALPLQVVFPSFPILLPPRVSFDKLPWSVSLGAV